MDYSKQLAKAALEIKAIKLQPQQPFRWASGYLMPIYNDNRKFFFYPQYRELIVADFLEKIKEHHLQPEVIVGVATSGIPHAVSLANRLNLPTAYVRDKKKGYGLQNQLEGIDTLKNKKVIVVEDLISTGGSSLNVVKAVRSFGGEVLACLAIFSYGLAQAEKNFRQENCPLFTLFTYDQLLETAMEENNLTVNDLQALQKWREDPFRWQDRFKEVIKPTENQLTEKEQEARKKLCLPLDDLTSLDEMKDLVEELAPYVGLFKIGKGSFTRFGPAAVKLVQDYGSEVFLDLKYHDIPNTVKDAAKAAAELGVDMFNVHASGGLEMMQAAKEGIAGYDHKPKIIGVTVLTSLDQQKLNTELNISGTVEEQVLHLAKLAQQAGLDGIVCSAADLQSIKNKLPADFLYVTPGIKGPTTAIGYDQKRVMTPGNALEDGTSILVVGRVITAAPDRKKAAYDILRDMARKL